MSKWDQFAEIKRFREYLKIPSVQPDVEYEPCVKFLKEQATELGLPYLIFYPADIKKPIFVITWVGKEPCLPSIILNSHMDVAPVVEENWTHPPFAADIDEEGRIYARGAQNMKCVGMQYLEAIRQLKYSGNTFKRTIHITFVPDEEIGGKLGMAEFVNNQDFKDLNVGFSLDEGYASTTGVYHVFNAERSIWNVYFNISGVSGHGSLLLENTVGIKLRYIMDKMCDFRANEVKRLENNPDLTIGDVTTINLTEINGGIQSNILPPLLVAGFNIRIALDVDHDEFENQLMQWCTEAGGGIELYYKQKEPKVQATKIDSTNPFWVSFRNCIDQLGLKIKNQVFPGGTDSRYIRAVGIPAIGFSPMINTPVLLHDNDEFLKADTYMEGIEIYKTIISKVANA